MTEREPGGSTCSLENFFIVVEFVAHLITTCIFLLFLTARLSLDELQSDRAAIRVLDEVSHLSFDEVSRLSLDEVIALQFKSRSSGFGSGCDLNTDHMTVVVTQELYVANVL